MGRQRVERAHPDLVPWVLQTACASGVQRFSVSATSVHRALERHYTEQLQAQLAQLRAELAEATDEINRAHDQLQEAEAALSRLHVQRLTQPQAGADAPATQLPQLYEVQAVRELAQVHAALREGAVLGSLGGGGGQLVVVRPAHVYGADSAPVQASTVLALGACVCTAEGLVAAQLPAPSAGGGQ